MSDPSRDPKARPPIDSSMSDGYYEPHATVVIRQSVALIGFFGAETEMIGRLLSSVTGLRFTSLDGLVEHTLGASRAAFIRERGEAPWRVAEAEALGRALADRPPGVLVFGDGALLDRRNLHRVRDETTLIYVHRPLDEVEARLRASRRDRPELDGLRELADLRALLRDRAPGYAAAALRVDGGDRAPLPIAREIAQRLDWPVF